MPPLVTVIVHARSEPLSVRWRLSKFQSLLWAPMMVEAIWRCCGCARARTNVTEGRFFHASHLCAASCIP